MSRPVLEVADIFRAWAGRYHRAQPRPHLLAAAQGHAGHRALPHGSARPAPRPLHRVRKDFGFSFNSCRNRHCPKCQTQARNRWVAARTRELVPLDYFHVVFTVPHQLSELMLQNKRVLYNLLFRSRGRHPAGSGGQPEAAGRGDRLSVRAAYLGTDADSPSAHSLRRAGRGLRPRPRPLGAAQVRAASSCPVDVLSEVFRGKFTDALKGLFRRKKLAFHGSLAWLAEPRSFARFLHTLHQHKWVVYVKKPFGGPEHVLHYLARYTHRVAISNHRLIGMEDGKVTFRWKDYAHGGKKRKMTLAAEEFIRRFLLHVLPKGLVRIRHYGWMANRCRARAGGASAARCSGSRPTASRPASDDTTRGGVRSAGAQSR